jgi:hypothetical protein
VSEAEGNASEARGDAKSSEPSEEPKGWSGTAYNGATASENRIHADDVAKRFGFRGGLVPGVTVFAYLAQPAIRAWGLEWLASGAASVVLRKPLYDAARFEVSVTPEPGRSYAGAVLDADGVLCADGRAWIPRELPAAPARRGDAPVPALETRPPATRAALEQLRARGMGALQLTWRGDGEMARTSPSAADMPDLVRADRAGFANPAFVLGLANWVLARNARLDAWIHAQSELQLYAAIPLGTAICVEARVVDLFARGGHEFVDLEVAAFSDDRPLLAAKHRALYRLRGSD